MKRNFTEDFRRAGKRDEGVEQSRSVTKERHSQPDQGHHFIFGSGAGTPLPRPRKHGDYSLSGRRSVSTARRSQLQLKCDRGLCSWLYFRLPQTLNRCLRSYRRIINFLKRVRPRLGLKNGQDFNVPVIVIVERLPITQSRRGVLAIG